MARNPDPYSPNTAHDISGMNPNSTAPLPSDGETPFFHICWRKQFCHQCLAGDAPCSWCSSSSTCVPNRSRLPIFAPISTPDICPLGPSERWELRARPFGCNVSTLTLLTAIVAVAGTLAAVGLGFGIAWAVGKLRRRWGQRKYTCGLLDCVGWGALRRRRNLGRLGNGGNGVFGGEGVIRDDAEARPLLG